MTARARPPFTHFCFDCDSTLARIEGIDELAGPLAGEIAALTHSAMSGGVALEAVYGRRLERIAPTRADVERLAARYIETIVDDAAAVVGALVALGKDVHLVTGGLAPAVVPLAAALAIPPQNVHAVQVYFDAHGDYAGYDTSSPLARSGGKGDVVASLPIDLARTVFIGDGVTDLEVQGRVGLFIGFGGVAARDVVRDASPIYIRVPHLAPVLAFTLTADEKAALARDPETRQLIAHAEALAGSAGVSIHES